MTRHTSTLLLILTTCFVSESCQDKNIPFNNTGWNESSDGVPCPPLRDKMLKDLLENHKLKGITYKQLIDKLGEPPICEICDPNSVSYEVIVKYGFDIDPSYIKTLDFYYDKDSIITDWKINEFKH